jgi:hypothetical protein
MYTLGANMYPTTFSSLCEQYFIIIRHAHKLYRKRFSIEKDSYSTFLLSSNSRPLSVICNVLERPCFLMPMSPFSCNIRSFFAVVARTIENFLPILVLILLIDEKKHLKQFIFYVYAIDGFTG